MLVENAFGRLKGRWRCLLKQNEASIHQMNAVVSTCCILRNVCEKNKEIFGTGLDTLFYTVFCVVDGTTQDNYDKSHPASATDNREALTRYCSEYKLYVKANACCCIHSYI